MCHIHIHWKYSLISNTLSVSPPYHISGSFKFLDSSHLSLLKSIHTFHLCWIPMAPENPLCKWNIWQRHHDSMHAYSRNWVSLKTIAISLEVSNDKPNYNAWPLFPTCLRLLNINQHITRVYSEHVSWTLIFRSTFRSFELKGKEQNILL